MAQEGPVPDRGKVRIWKEHVCVQFKAEFMYNFVDGKWKDVYGFHNVHGQMKCLTISSWLQNMVFKVLRFTKVVETRKDYSPDESCMLRQAGLKVSQLFRG